MVSCILQASLYPTIPNCRQLCTRMLCRDVAPPQAGATVAAGAANSAAVPSADDIEDEEITVNGKPT